MCKTCPARRSTVWRAWRARRRVSRTSRRSSMRRGWRRSDGAAAGVVVRGIPRADLEALPIVASNIRPGGGFMGFEGVEAPTILIGDRLAASMGVVEGMALSILSPQGAATPFGLTPRRKSFLIGGVFSVGMAEFDSGLIYMPLEQAQILFSRGDGADELEIRIDDPDRTLAIMMALRDRLGPDVHDLRLARQEPRPRRRARRRAQRDAAHPDVRGRACRAQHRHRPHHAGEEQEPRHRHPAHHRRDQGRDHARLLHGERYRWA